MALNLIQADEPITVSNIILYVYSDPDMWKTSLGMTGGKKTLLIDADRGAHRIDRDFRQATGATIAKATVWEEIRSITYEDIEPFDTIVIDTVGRLLDIIRVFLAKNRQNIKNDGTLKIQVQQVANNLFSDFVNRFLAAGKDVVFLAHAIEDKNEDKNIVRPDLGGRNRQDLYRMSDCMAYLTYDRDSNGRSGRILKFGKGENYHSKDCAKLGNITIPDLINPKKAGDFNTDFLGSLIGRIKDKINTLTEDERAAIKAEQEWLHWCQCCQEAKYPSEYNTMMEELDKEHPRFIEMWEFLKGWAISKNFLYNKHNQRWLDREDLITEEERNELLELIDKHGQDTKTIAEAMGVSNLLLIRQDKWETVVQMITSKPIKCTDEVAEAEIETN